MKNKNTFFLKQEYIYLSDILKILGKKNIKKKIKINSIADLTTASVNDISFINNLKYLEVLKKSKAKYIISNKMHFDKIKDFCVPIIVNNVLKSVYAVTKLFYPDSLNDAVDYKVTFPDKKKFKKIKFGQNVLIGKMLKLEKILLLVIILL